MEIRASSPEIQAILEAAVQGNIEYLKQVNDNELFGAYCRSGCSALHWAAGSSQSVAVKYLIEDRGFRVNVLAKRKAQGRTPLHYACRNGCLEVARLLIEEYKADPNALAKHGVTPLQLAVWRNYLDICQYLVIGCGVEPHQVNNFDCGAVHWLGIATVQQHDKDEDGSALLPLARWLAEQNVDFQSRQRQGHSALHKAAWGGHLALCRYFHEEHNLWDDSPDEAGNYAADLCDMANTARHAQVAQYLRNHCSRERAQSCAILGIDVDADDTTIRQAYLEAARQVHPDRGGASHDFHQMQKAYRHLVHQNGRGSQSNPAHSLKLMLQVSGASHNPQEDDCFKARLIAVLLEYGNKGLDLSNLKKKWKQVWPDASFPNENGKMSDWIRQEAEDVVELRFDGKGSLRLYPKICSQAQVVAAATEIK